MLKISNKRILFLIIRLVIIIVFLYVLLFHVIGVYINDSTNMNPSVKPGDLVITYRLNKQYEKGDIILINNSFVRIVGSCKDEITINENNQLLINGQMIEEEIYFDTFIDSESNIKYPYIVEKGEYFVLNDYRLDNNDSRSFGSINTKDVKGLVIASIRIKGF